MSEHIVALALAAAKRLFIEHANLKSGEFNQRSANRMLCGGVCGILGFGNVGVATARLMRAFGMKIHAINRRGASHEPTDWIATTDLLDDMLRVADVLVISAALTTATEGLIGARELDLMKENAISMSHVARPSMREHSTRILSPIRTFSPASTRGGWNRCGTATSRWVTRFSTSRTLSARRTIRRAAGHGVTNTSGALCKIVCVPSLVRHRGTLSGSTSGCCNRHRRAASDDGINRWRDHHFDA